MIIPSIIIDPIALPHHHITLYVIPLQLSHFTSSTTVFRLLFALTKDPHSITRYIVAA